MNDSALGVVVVTYGSADVIIECLESLLASSGVTLKVVVVDNASSDDTVEAIRDWASGKSPYVPPMNSPLSAAPPIPKPIDLVEAIEGAEGARQTGALGRLTLVRSCLNRGYAGGVNLGIETLRGQVGLYWVLNPDCATPPETAGAYVAGAAARPDFGLMSCPVIYYAAPDRIQTAGGRVNRLTGVCSHRLPDAPLAELRSSPLGELDWVTGANLVVSEAFVEQVGLMREDYFLYYEEVDWAFRRDAFPIVFLTDAVVYHHGGTAIGSGSMLQRPSAFSNYFNYRNRIRFSRRFLGRPPIAAYLYGLAKAAQIALAGEFDEAHAILAGIFELPPPKSVTGRISDPRSAQLAFGRTQS